MGGICIILMLIYNTEYIKYVTYGIGIFSIPNKTWSVVMEKSYKIKKIKKQNLSTIIL